MEAFGEKQDYPQNVVWAGEFGRTPFAQGANGRDHNQFGFTVWLAGGGIQGGMMHGETDDFSYNVIQNPVAVRDLHATLLYQLVIDHTRLTFPFQGLDQRLTGVEPARVVHEILS